MSFVGTLDEMPLPEILQFLAMSGRDGKLWLTCTDGHGLILFRKGRIIYAASNSVRETFGSILLCRGLVDEPTLLRALERQHQCRQEKRLGTILVEMGAISEETVTSVIRQQVERVIVEFLAWKGGFFKFDPMLITPHGEVAVDAKEFLLPQGVSGEGLALELSRRADELDRSGEPAGAAAGGADGPDAGGVGTPPDFGAPGPFDGAGDAASVFDDTERDEASLSSLTADLGFPLLTGELAMELIRRASGTVSRCVLFLRRREDFVGVGGFGIRAGQLSPQAAVRSLVLPLDEESVIARAAATGRSFIGPLSRSRWNDRLVEQLGGEAPVEVMTVPVLLAGRCVAVLYGDNAPGATPVGTIGALELLATEVGVAMEKAAARRAPGVVPLGG